MKLALIHEWLTTYAGSEKVVEAILERHPNSPIFTAVHNPAAFKRTLFEDADIHTSFIQKLPKGVQHYQKYLPLLPLAVEQHNVSDADVIVSSHHAVAHGVRTRADQLHLSYVHTPMRYAWDLQESYLRDSGFDRGVKGLVARLVLHYLRLWDTTTAHRVDLFMANSNYVARRIWRAYRRPAKVIYPPVDVERFYAQEKREEFFLTLSRLVPYKKIDLIAQAFSELGLPLVIIGDGPDLEKIKSVSKENVVILGKQPDLIVQDYMSRCRAFVFAADEDFGITTVEAQASGAPVLAYGKGGSLEIVKDGQTGFFFLEQTVQEIKRAVATFDRHPPLDSLSIRESALRFSKKRFQKEFEETLERSWISFQEGIDPEKSVFGGPL